MNPGSRLDRTDHRSFAGHGLYAAALDPKHEYRAMKRIGIAVLYGVGGYLVSAMASYVLVAQLSSNVHDRSIEAAMTSAFVWGPLGAVVAFIVGFVRSGRGGGRTSEGG